jgi:hypothetical protein
VECRNWWDTIAVPLERDWIVRRYWYTYCGQRPLDVQRMNYYRAWVVLRRLAIDGRWRVGGPASTGSKDAVLHYLQRSHLDELRRAFHGWTGVSIG